MSQKFTTSNYTQTQAIGKKIAAELKTGTVLALYGNLGSGKTTFTQGLAKGLGIKQKIISPTFIIVRKYDLSSLRERSESKGKDSKSLRQAQATNFYHIDLYRIENVNDVASLGLEEILNDKSNIVAIEWPEKIEKILPKNTTRLYFEYLPAGRQGLEDNKREIKIP